MVSFRLGGTDGVAIEAAKWIGALRSLGHDVVTVAGGGTPERTVVGLGIDDQTGPDRTELASSLAGADLVIVENLVSLPLNLAARDAVYDVLEGRRAIFHHHDLAWQRTHLAHHDPPRTGERWLIVTSAPFSTRSSAISAPELPKPTTSARAPL